MADEAPLTLHLMENGYLVMSVWDHAKQGDPIARSIFRKLKAHAIACGVVWHYGDPWPMDGEEHPP